MACKAKLPNMRVRSAVPEATRKPARRCPTRRVASSGMACTGRGWPNSCPSSRLVRRSVGPESSRQRHSICTRYPPDNLTTHGSASHCSTVSTVRSTSCAVQDVSMRCLTPELSHAAKRRRLGRIVRPLAAYPGYVAPNRTERAMPAMQGRSGGQIRSSQPA